MNDVVEQIKDNCDIVDIVGRYVQLKRAGSNYKGLCPFHGEKTPSFVVSPDKQIFNCFGCGKKGDVINFIQEAENIDFREALEKLGEIAGIEVNNGSGYRDKKKEELYNVSREAAIHFYKNLRRGANEGLKYLIGREISPETARKFGIGYAENGWRDLADFFKTRDIPKELGLEAGLLSEKKGGDPYDKFRNRLIFPIKNTRNKVIGFGGRAVSGEMPKYLNSPETLIFKKKENLYGLDQAKNAIRKKNRAILVEGYMDVVSLADRGIENAVATLGTALTPEQARLIRKYTDTVILSYDSDDAGQAATMRGIDILKSAGLRVRILLLDEGKDPDEYIKKNGKEAFEKLTEKAVTDTEYIIDILKKKHDLKTTDGSIRFLEEASAKLRKIKSPAEQATYIKYVSELSGIPESSLRREVEAGGGGTGGFSAAGAGISREDTVTVKPEHKTDNPEPAEEYKTPVVRMLIKLMIQNGKYIPKIAADNEISTYFYGSGYEGILEQIVINYCDDSETDTEAVVEAVSEEEEMLFRDIMNNMLPVGNEDDTFKECVNRIKIHNLRKRQKTIMKLLEVLDEEGNEEEIRTLSEEMMEIGNSINNIKK